MKLPYSVLISKDGQILVIESIKRDRRVLYPNGEQASKYLLVDL